MKNINIKVIKANAEKVKEVVVSTTAVENEEKQTIRKITRNVNNWIQEYHENRATFKYPSFIH